MGLQSQTQLSNFHFHFLSFIMKIGNAYFWSVILDGFPQGGAPICPWLRILSTKAHSIPLLQRIYLYPSI